MKSKKLRCKHVPIFNGKKLMEFTKGKIYNFEYCYDPEGWQTQDDFGNKEVFFLTDKMFEEL